MSTQFGDNYHKWARVTKATMRIHHKPGDTMEVDWAGATIDIYDPVTGDTAPAYLFVAVLSCSCYVLEKRTSIFMSCFVISCINIWRGNASFQQLQSRIIRIHYSSSGYI